MTEKKEELKKEINKDIDRYIKKKELKEDILGSIGTGIIMASIIAICEFSLRRKDRKR